MLLSVWRPSAIRSINAFAAFAGVCCGKERHGKAVDFIKRRCYWQLPSRSSMKDRPRTARRPPKTAPEAQPWPGRAGPIQASTPASQAFLRWPSPSAHDPPPSGAGRSLHTYCKLHRIQNTKGQRSASARIGHSVCLTDRLTGGKTRELHKVPVFVDGIDDTKHTKQLHNVTYRQPKGDSS